MGVKDLHQKSWVAASAFFGLTAMDMRQSTNRNTVSTLYMSTSVSLAVAHARGATGFYMTCPEPQKVSSALQATYSTTKMLRVSVSSIGLMQQSSAVQLLTSSPKAYCRSVHPSQWWSVYC